MKQWITLLAATALFASCSKQDIQQDEMQKPASRSSAMKSTQSGAYVSDWETNNEWTKTDNGNMSKFTWMRKTTEIGSDVINGGLVLTYAKFASADPAYASFQMPKGLPMYFLPEAERPNTNMYYFSNETSDGLLTVTYNSPFTKEDWPKMGGGATLNSIRFQNVVLSKSFLDSHGVTADAVRNYYSYEQVMNLINQ